MSKERKHIVWAVLRNCPRTKISMIATIIGLSLFLATGTGVLAPKLAVAQEGLPGRSLDSEGHENERAQIDKAIAFLEKYGYGVTAENLKKLLKEGRLRADDELKGGIGGEHHRRIDSETRPPQSYSVITVNPDHLKKSDKFTDELKLAGILRHEKAHERSYVIDPEIAGRASSWSMKGSRDCTDNNWFELEAYYSDILFLLNVKNLTEIDKSLSQKERMARILAILERIGKIKEIISEKEGTEAIEKPEYSWNGETLKQFNDRILKKPLTLEEYQEKLFDEVRARLQGAFSMVSKSAEKQRALEKQSSTESIAPDQGGKVENKHQRISKGQTYEYVASVEILPNALGQPFDISVTLLDDSFPQAWSNEMHFLGPAYDFTPSGLTLPVDKPAIITLPYHPNADLRAADAYRLNELGEWKRITHGKTIDHLNRTVSVQTYHLSIYAVGAPPRIAHNPCPKSGAKDVPLSVILSWTAGGFAVAHDVYFSTDFNKVNDANRTFPLGVLVSQNQDANYYKPGTLELNTAYYWRIDEVNDFHPDSPWKGDVWRFTTLPDIPITDPNLFGWWKLDEGAGTVATDSSGRGDNGTINNPNGGLGPGSSVWYSDTERGTVASFSGDNSSGAYVSAGNIPAMSLTNDFTWAFWGKQDGDGTGVNEVILGNRYGGTASPLQFIKFTPTKFEFYNDDTSYVNSITYTEPIPGGVWVHHAAVKDGATLTYYRNGVKAGTSTITKTVDKNPFFMGGDANGERWRGLLSDVRIYDRALTAAQIKALVPLADLTDDGVVDMADLKVLSQEWLTAGIEADIYPDDIVDFRDFAVLASQWLEEFLWP